MKNFVVHKELPLVLRTYIV